MIEMSIEVEIATSDFIENPDIDGNNQYMH